jgi:hypothetical protein
MDEMGWIDFENTRHKLALSSYNDKWIEKNATG